MHSFDGSTSKVLPSAVLVLPKYCSFVKLLGTNSAIVHVSSLAGIQQKLFRRMSQLTDQKFEG